MIKDKVIRPLLIATEKVVEYYFPSEEKQEPGSKVANLITQIQGKLHLGGHHPGVVAAAVLNRSSAGATTTKTTGDETTSLSDESNEFAKIKRRLKKLDLNSMDDS